MQILSLARLDYSIARSYILASMVYLLELYCSECRSSRVSFYAWYTVLQSKKYNLKIIRSFYFVDILVQW
jgi:hypothetical protein